MESCRAPGVGRKTANVVLGNAFGRRGFVVDTHVGRLSRRLGFTRQTDPVKIEQDLNVLVPKGRRTLGAHLLIAHGRSDLLRAEASLRGLCRTTALPENRREANPLKCENAAGLRKSVFRRCEQYMVLSLLLELQRIAVE